MKNPARAVVVVALAACAACTTAASDHRTTVPEAAYVADIKARLAERERAVVSFDPELRCRDGRTQVWFVLDREGHVKDEGIARPSTVDELDRVAIRIVRQTAFAPMSDDLWAGRPDSRFAIQIDFVPRADCPG